jgi:two-component system LytT family response regulator
MKIKTIIVDDERKSIETLKHSLVKLCPDIEIIGETQDPLEAISLIETLKPELVFLDLAMPEISGFDVLSRIKNPDFEVIFATAFDDYAIKAISYCAIGYLVKPISDEELIEAVYRAKVSINQKEALKKNIQLIENIGVRTFQEKKIIVPTPEGLEFIKTSDIIYCEGIEGYTKLHFTDKKPDMLSSKSIGYYHKMLQEQSFFLSHKSYMINLCHIEKYKKEGYVLLSEGHTVPISRNKRNDFLNKIQEMT